MKLGQERAALQRLHVRLVWVWLLILALVVGLLTWDLGWYRLLGSFLPDLQRDMASKTPIYDLATLIVDMDYANYDQILGQRERALRDGVFVSSEQDFVPATIRVDQTTIPVKMRLMEGPTRYSETSEWWNLEVRVRDDRQILGLGRFYLQDPEANNWLNQWAFARALQREGILTARYEFVRLIFNGNDKGIYAVQESFAAELLEAQGRSRGVIVRFNADLLWEAIMHFGGDAEAAFADPVTNLSMDTLEYLEIDTLHDPDPAQTVDIASQREQAIALLHSLQTGLRPASQVLDIEQYGTLLALTDLWGAIGGVSFVNLGYYYNPVTQRLEPIASNADALGSQARLSLTTTFDDPWLQVAYVRQASRIAQPEYVDQIQAALEEEWQSLANTLRVENKDLIPPWKELRKRQEDMRRSLDPVQSVFAYLDSSQPGEFPKGYAALQIYVGNVLNLPVEVLGFEINGATFVPVDPEWVQAGTLVEGMDGVVLKDLNSARFPVVEYARFSIPLSKIQEVDREIDYNRELEIQVVTRIASGSDSRLTPVRYGLPAGVAE
ncbi:MAG: hypothetical protein JXA89_18400 [Anaerolineae bacterium]|nr:hypothetical protein [Anaerolineae bacterium]